MIRLILIMQLIFFAAFGMAAGSAFAFRAKYERAAQAEVLVQIHDLETLSEIKL